jgi:hypothetical protein
MKKLFVLLLFLSFNVYHAQEKGNIFTFSNFRYGVYGGINFETGSEVGGSFLIEVKTNVISNMNMNFSLGYSKLYHTVSYSVKKYSIYKIDNKVFYNAEHYNVNKYMYDIFPFSLGFQYVFKMHNFSPYLLIDLSYNIINGKIVRTPGGSISYNSFDEIPNEYKNTNFHIFPNHSPVFDIKACREG